jgi:outer membrane receptor protein involved in Fe transport
MAKSRSLQQAVRFALATAAAATGVSALHAQEAPAPTAAPVEEVVVTGSRLRTPNETAISPITSISAVDLQQTGLTRVEDVLNNLPMVFAGMNSTTSNGADGTASVDLRGLGNQRTLTLVNGLRLGPGSAIGGRNFSDINQIPAALIERVDVLTGGASAVYGADAVAGVVNFVLNTHFEGIRVDAGYHFNQHDNKDQAGVASVVSAAGDALPRSNVNTGFGKNVSVLMGSNFSDNKGNVTAYVTYDNQGPTLQSNFDYSACTLAPAGPAKLACVGSGTAAKNGAGGHFYASNASGVSFIAHTVDGLTGVFRPIAAGDTYNFGPLNYYQTPNERWTAGAFLNYDVNQHVNAYSSVMYMRNQQAAQIAPSGDFFQNSFIPCADPLLTAQERTIMCTPANLAAQGNPFETFNGVNYPGLNFVIGRRNVEGGPRIATFITDSAREVIGLKGDFGDAWTYNVYGQHATVDNNNGNLNYLSNNNIDQALNVLPGANGPVCGGPSSPVNNGPLVGSGTGFTVNPQCAPWNVWVPHGVTPAALAFMSVPLLLEGTVTEYVADGSVTGDIGKYGAKLPWADQGLQVNVGVEWRQEDTNFLPDFLSQQGSAAGSGGPTKPISGGFTVKEVFTEMRLPIASHQPFADDLAFEGGYRYSKYSEGFSTNTYKLGLEWAPIRDVRVRGSFQRAVRAPNIGELFTPNAVLLDGSIDPCAAPLAAGSPAAPNPAAVLTNGVTYAQCAPSFPSAAAATAQFGHVLPNTAPQYNGLLGGNTQLEPEVADTYTVGLVLQPRLVPNLTLSFDYFDIKIKNIIGAIGGNNIINDCISNGLLCNQVHRDATGSLWRTNTGYIIDTTVNEGELKTTGLDVKGSYRQTVGRFGTLLASLEGTKLKDLITTPVPGTGSYDCKGFWGPICGGGNPDWRSVLNLTWSTPWDGLDLNVRWRYFGSDTVEFLSPSKFLKAPAYLPLAHIPAYSWFDLTGTFNVYKNVRLELGVNNIADKVPPLAVGTACTTSSGGGNSGANCNGNTFPGVYDAMGRYLFATITAQF